MVSRRFGLRVVVILSIILFSLSLGLGHWGAINYPVPAFFLLPTRAWQILLGVFAAFYLLYNKDFHEKINPLLRQTLGLLGLALIGYSIFTFDQWMLLSGLPTLIPTVGATLVILFATRNTYAGRLLSLKVLVGIGLVSYSAYLWHQPLMAFARQRSLTEPSEWLMAFLCVLTFVLAYISWRFVEQPFRSKRFGRKQVFFGASFALTLIASIGVVGIAGNGFLLRLSESQKMALKTAVPSPMRGQCHSNPGSAVAPADSCVYFGENPTWAVIGDSHAVELAYSLAQELDSRKERVMHLSFSGCVPAYLDTSGAECSEWTKKAFDYVAGNDDIKNVVVSYRIASALHGLHEGVYPEFPDDIRPDERDLRWKSLLAELQLLVDAGKNVVYIMQAPELPVTVSRLVFYGKDDMRAGKLRGVPRDWWARRIEYVTEHLDEIPEGVRVVDPQDLFCDSEYCYAVVDGYSVYFDDDHMSVYGASVVSDRIINN